MRRVRPFPWQPDIRASDREREQVAAFLSHHCAEGRLTAEELAERTEAAYRAVWLAELAELARDLPGSPFAAPAPVVRTRRSWHSGVVVCAFCFLVLLALAVSALPPAAWVLLLLLSVPFLLLGVPLLMMAFAMLAPIALVGLGIVWAARALIRPRQPEQWLPPPRR